MEVYDFWMIIVPRILAVLLTVASGLWATTIISRIWTSYERRELRRRVKALELYRKRTQDLLTRVSTVPNLPADLFVEVADNIYWHHDPRKEKRENTYY